MSLQAAPVMGPPSLASAEAGREIALIVNTTRPSSSCSSRNRSAPASGCPARVAYTNPRRLVVDQLDNATRDLQGQRPQTPSHQDDRVHAQRNVRGQHSKPCTLVHPPVEEISAGVVEGSARQRAGVPQPLKPGGGVVQRVGGREVRQRHRAELRRLPLIK